MHTSLRGLFRLYSAVRFSLCVSCQRAIIQRVLSASVTVGGQTISSIHRGLVVLVGISRTDTLHDCDYIARKLLNLKLFDSQPTTTNSSSSSSSPSKPWSQSVQSLQLDVLLVSQFTLYAELKGNRPDFHTAMPPIDARQLYDRLVALVRSEYGEAGMERVKDGQFGADMQVQLVNDGPVTISLSTDDKSFDRQLAKDSRPFSERHNHKNGRSSSPSPVPASSSSSSVSPSGSSDSLPAATVSADIAASSLDGSSAASHSATASAASSSSTS